MSIMRPVSVAAAVAAAAAAAASLLAIPSAWAGCLPCGCGPVAPCGPAYAVVPVLGSPVQQTFFVEQGPTRPVVIVSGADWERRVEFSHPHRYPYVGSRHDPRYAAGRPISVKD